MMPWLQNATSYIFLQMYDGANTHLHKGYLFVNGFIQGYPNYVRVLGIPLTSRRRDNRNLEILNLGLFAFRVHMRL